MSSQSSPVDETAGLLDEAADGTDGTPGSAPGPVEATFRRALRHVLVFLAVLAVVSVGVGWAVSGTAGLWGALLGVAVAVLFSATTVVVMLRTAHSTPATTAMVVLGSWLAKMLVLVVVLAVIRDADFYDRWVFGAVILLGTVGSAILDYRAVAAGRIPYTEPGK